MTIVYRSTALLLLIAGSLMSQGPIDTTTIPPWDGELFGGHLGTPNTATFGQTINIGPGSAVVSSFGVEIGNCNATITFRGEIYSWVNGRANTRMFESPATTQGPSEVFSLVTFNTGSLTLAPGDYVLFVTTSRDQITPARCEWGALLDTTAYPAGQNVFLNNGADTSQWTSELWDTEPVDLAFQVNMAPVPPPPPPPVDTPAASPATLLLGFAGVIALGLLGLSRLRTAR